LVPFPVLPVTHTHTAAPPTPSVLPISQDAVRHFLLAPLVLLWFVDLNRAVFVILFLVFVFIPKTLDE